MGKLLALVGVGLASLALIGTALANHSWGGYHWSRSANPLVLNVGDNVDARWDAYLNEAIADWSASTVLDLNKAAGGTSPSSCNPTAGRMEVCNGSYGSTGWLGIAQIWAHEEQPHHPGDDEGQRLVLREPAVQHAGVGKQMVMCQEVGHDSGSTIRTRTSTTRISERAWTTPGTGSVHPPTSTRTRTTTRSSTSSTPISTAQEGAAALPREEVLDRPPRRPVFAGQQGERRRVRRPPAGTGAAASRTCSGRRSTRTRPPKRRAGACRPLTCRIRERTLSLGDGPRSPSRRRACLRASPPASPASPRRLPRW